MSERPRIAVVGAGRFGTRHLETLATLQVEGAARIAGVVEIDRARGEAAATKHAVPWATHIDDLDVEADGCVIAAPTEVHGELAAEALGRGWHVLVEKPITPAVAEAERLIELARSADRVLQVGHVERFNPAVDAALDLLGPTTGAPARYVVCERLGPFTGRSTDIDVVLDLMVHDLDIVATLIPSRLVEVRAIGVPVLTDQIDMAAARLSFECGSVAQLSAGRVSLEASRKIRLFTPQRYLSIDCGALAVKTVKRVPGEDGGDPFITGDEVNVEKAQPLELQARDFLRCIREGGTPRVDGEAGLRALQLAERVRAEMSVPVS